MGTYKGSSSSWFKEVLLSQFPLYYLNETPTAVWETENPVNGRLIIFFDYHRTVFSTQWQNLLLVYHANVSKIFYVDVDFNTAFGNISEISCSGFTIAIKMHRKSHDIFGPPWYLLQGFAKHLLTCVWAQETRNFLKNKFKKHNCLCFKRYHSSLTELL